MHIISGRPSRHSRSLRFLLPPFVAETRLRPAHGEQDGAAVLQAVRQDVQHHKVAQRNEFYSHYFTIFISVLV